MSGKRPHEGSMSNKRQRSEVWEHFDKTPDGERAICKHCGKSLGAISTRGTSHLKRHPCIKNLTGDVGQPVTLESYHEDINIGDVGQLVTLESTHEARNIGDVGQPVTLESNHEAINIGYVGQPVTLESTHEAKDITWKDEVKKAILAEIPFASSDVKKCWYSLTGLTDIEKEIRAYYEFEKEKLAIELKNLPSRVSFSFQIEEELGYISITAHFINEDFNLVRRLIGFKKLTDIKSKSCIVDAIRSCISDWKLGDKIFTFVRGYSPYIYGMKESLEECFSSKLWFKGNFIYHKCCKEVLIDFYTDCMYPLWYQENSNIDKAIKHVKEVSSGMDIFNKLAEEKRLPPINGDWLNEYTRCSWDVESEDPEYWKPAIKKFKEVRTYKDVFNQYAEIAGRCLTVNEGSSMLDNGHSGQLDNIDFFILDRHVEVGQSSELNTCSIDWERVEEAILFFDLMLKVIDGLSTSNYPTSNLYFPNLMEIEDFILNLKERLEILDRFGDVISHGKSLQFFELANALDPRYKLICKEYYGRFYADWDTYEERELYEKIFCAYANDEINDESPKCMENTNTQEQGGGTIANKFYKYVKEKKKTRKSELDKYLDDELVDLDDASFNILSWWKQNRSRYPVLSRMARDILAVPTCVHSIEGIISSTFKLLEGVSPQLVEAVVCSKDWIPSGVQSVPQKGN